MGILDIYEKGMSGLLGPSENYGGLISAEDQAAAKKRAQLQFGLSMLANSGPSTERRGFGQILGNSALQAQGAQSDALQKAAATVLQNRQMKIREDEAARLNKGDLVPVMEGGRIVYKPAGQASGSEVGFTPLNTGKPSANIQDYERSVSDPGFLDFLERRSAAMASNPFSPTDMAGGRGVTDKRTGQYTPLTTAEQEASGRGVIAGAEAGAKTTATAQAEKAVALPSTIEALNKMQTNIQSLLDDPGFDTIYGMSSVLSPSVYIRGSNASNALAKREQLEGQTFLASIQSMRGFGQLSNNEGLKVTQAYTRATNPKISEEEARTAWKEVFDGLERLKKVVAQEAGQSQGGRESAADRAKRLGL